jgi:GntR family transcriptional repressor for pyruvate dehydrogenase complex
MFKPIESKRKSELIAEEIEHAILGGSLKPEDRLPSERDLATQMNVSRSAVREALRTLEIRGLIYTKTGPEGGNFAKKPDAALFIKSFTYMIRIGGITIDQLTEARLPIEKEIIELAIRKSASVDDFRPLDDLISGAYKEQIAGGIFRFHKLLAELSKNPILVILNDSILAVIDAFVENLNPPLSHRMTVLESHRAILDEMKKGNVLSAQKKCEEHIVFFAEEYKQMMVVKNLGREDFKAASL